MKMPTPAAAIKWTDEEWSKIADRLQQDKGDVLLHSATLEEIKARDVFEAQQVLSSERHRKLISIAQGFQGIRARLHTIFQKMQAAAAAAPAAPAAEPERQAAPAAAAQPDSDPQQSLGLHAPPQAAQPQPAAEQPAAALEADEPATSDSEDAAPAALPEPAEAGPAKAEAAAVPAQAAAVAAEAAAVPAAAAAHAAPQAAPLPERAEAASAKGDFIEMARPFVAMFCEEFAKALVQAMAGQPGLLQQATGLKPEMPPARPPRQGGDRPRPQAEPAAPARPAPPAPSAPSTEHFEEDASHPAEVQPLFDPKLPPSANSDFKPMIGLVATRAHEYEDLQMLYPQLQLCIVQADAIRGPDAFRNCQRIIGLRDEVPPAIDDLLRRSLRHRYVRLNGGALRVREQLNSWLDKPGTINSTPRPQQQRNDKRPGPGNGKKRHKWPPRADR
jgi:hypothetical protein